MSSSADNEIGVSTYPTGAQRKTAPRIVAFGGGTGMAALLRGLKAYTDRLRRGRSTGRVTSYEGFVDPVLGLGP